MAEIVGLIPMAGNGTRLGMSFPKPLAPTITGAGIVPLYYHTLGELRKVAGRIIAITSESTDMCLIRSLRENGIEEMTSAEENLPGSFGYAGRVLTMLGYDTIVVTVLPDSIWSLANGASLGDVVENMRSDGALALFTGASNEIDEVETDGDRVVRVTTKSSGAGMVRGWGAFAIRAGALAKMTGKEKDGPQLGRLDMGWAFLGGYVDLGTPERYIRWHDMRWR